MSVPVDWKPQRAIQAKIRDMQKNIYSRWIENPKGWFRQKLGISKKKQRRNALKRKAMTIWRVNWKGILVQFRNGDFLLSFGLLGYTPTAFWLKGFIPTMFVSSLVMLSPFKVTKYLYCDVGPLSDLPMFVFIVLPLYCPLNFIHMHSCIHSMHTDIIHTWLHCQSYF